MRLLLAALLLALVTGCSSSSSEPTDPVVAPDSWLGLAPGNARAFHGPGGKLILIPVDETYAIDGANASAVTWALGNRYTTDYWVQDDDGTLWWYGRKGSWRAGRHGEKPREVPLGDGTATFGDRTITLGDDGPTRLETPEGTYEPAGP
ncbi:hypothetical protein [Nocardioides aquiterrae]|uniref:Uncharacterized protein n=1 Tax=Nocardioides aquiterrae TaxID=203799 RepID=A0ABP4EVN6_9ACTN